MTVEKVKEAVETIQDYCKEKQSCCDCAFYKPYQLGFCDRYFKACICDWNLNILSINKIHLKDKKEK